MNRFKAFVFDYALNLFLLAVLLCMAAFTLPTIWNKAKNQDTAKPIATNLR